MVVWIHKSGKKIFDRSVDGDFVVKAQNKISEMFLRKNTFYSENTIYPYLTEKDFKDGIVTRCKNIIKSYRPDHPWLGLTGNNFFRSAGLYRTDYANNLEGFTLSALLLFGKDEVIASVLPYYKIDAIVRREDLERYDDRITVTSNLIDSYDLLIAFIEKHLPDKFYLEGDKRVSLRERLFREIIVNMLIHREYMNPFISRLTIFSDRVEVYNANKPFRFSALDMTNFQSYPKNPHISTFFAQLGMAEYLGTGIPNIYKFNKLYSNKEPEIVDNDLFTVTIYLNGTLNGTLNGILNGTLNGTLNQSQKSVYELIVANNGINGSEIIALLNMPRDTFNKVIKFLADNNLIEHRGSKKKGGYFVK